MIISINKKEINKMRGGYIGNLNETAIEIFKKEFK